ncbi:unnamed protein product, partial [Durusdinium trenchii]
GTASPQTAETHAGRSARATGYPATSSGNCRILGGQPAQDGGVASPGQVEAPHLEQLCSQLQGLRGRYMEMLGRCEEFRHQLCEAQAKKEAHRTAADQKRRNWEKLVAEHQLLVDQGEAEIERLREEVEEAQRRQEKVQKEQERLERAARQDRVSLEQLRLKLRQMEARKDRKEP